MVERWTIKLLQASDYAFVVARRIGDVSILDSCGEVLCAIGDSNLNRGPGWRKARIVCERFQVSEVNSEKIPAAQAEFGLEDTPFVRSEIRRLDVALPDLGAACIREIVLSGDDNINYIGQEPFGEFDGEFFSGIGSGLESMEGEHPFLRLS